MPSNFRGQAENPKGRTRAQSAAEGMPDDDRREAFAHRAVFRQIKVTNQLDAEAVFEDDLLARRGFAWRERVVRRSRVDARRRRRGASVRVPAIARLQRAWFFAFFVGLNPYAEQVRPDGLALSIIRYPLSVFRSREKKGDRDGRPSSRRSGKLQRKDFS